MKVNNETVDNVHESGDSDVFEYNPQTFSIESYHSLRRRGIDVSNAIAVVVYSLAQWWDASDPTTTLMTLAVDAVKQLIVAGADLEGRTGQDLETAFQIAAENSFDEIVELLIGAGCNLEARSVYGTAIIATAAWGHDNILCQLIKAGADVNAKRDDGFTACHFAAENGNNIALSSLINAGANVNACSDFGSTPLFGVTGRTCKHSNVVAKLISAGANISPCLVTRPTRTKFYPLLSIAAMADTDAGILAVFDNNRDIDFDIDDTDEQGFTALAWAVICENERTCKALIACGASIYYQRNFLTSSCFKWLLAADLACNDPLVVQAIFSDFLARDQDEDDTTTLFNFDLLTTYAYPSRINNNQSLWDLAKLHVESKDFRDWIDALENESCSTNPTRFEEAQNNLFNARDELAAMALKRLKNHLLVICIALQYLNLPALVTLYIVDSSLRNATLVPMIKKWNIITAVKHFRHL